MLFRPHILKSLYASLVKLLSEWMEAASVFLVPETTHYNDIPQEGEANGISTVILYREACMYIIIVILCWTFQTFRTLQVLCINNVFNYIVGLFISLCVIPML